MASSVAHPLPNHPEFSVIEHAGCHEYRVQNRRVSHSIFSLSLRSLVLTLCMAMSVQLLPPVHSYSLIVIFFLFAVKETFLKILYESVILLPPHGIQLETHRGIPGLRSLFSSKRFISSTSLEDVIVNEGLSGWNVFYHLAVVKRTVFSGTAMDVAFQNLLPPHPILLETFVGIHQFILSRPSQTTESKMKANMMD